MDVKTKFWDIIESEFGTISDKDSIVSLSNDLNFSSFDIVQLIVDVEEALGIEITEELLDLEVLDEPHKFIELIEKLQA